MKDPSTDMPRTGALKIGASILLIVCLFGLTAPEVRAARGDPESAEEWIERIERAERTSGETWSVLVKDLATGEVLLEHEPDQKLIPASNRKITTFALALERFGPEYQFNTELGLTPGERTPDGWVSASLVLRSEGDPSFSQKYLRNQNPADYLRSWIDYLDTLSLTHIRGSFYIDASAFGPDQQTFPIIWDPANRNQSFSALPSAITFNGNVLMVRASPSSTQGRVGRISIYPETGNIRLQNETRTVGGRVEGLAAEFSMDGSALMLKGALGQRAGPQVVLIPMPRPLDYLQALIAQYLKEEGVEVLGGVHVVTDPRRARELNIERIVARHESPPLPDLLREMMLESDNFFAEQIWRASARRALGEGTPDAGRRNEQMWLGDRSLSWIEPGYDGSGLSRLNRISALDLVAELDSIFRSPYGPYLIHSLPVSGKSGTLRHREFAKKDGRVYAKTGTLSGVSALSGFIMDTEGRPRWIFSMLGNAHSNTNGRLTMRQNQIMKILIRTLDGEEDGPPERSRLKRRDPELKIRVERPS